MEIKWDREALVARCLTRNDRYSGTADPECLGDQPDHRVIRRAVRRRFGDADLELLAPVGACAPAADPRLRRARRHANREHAAHTTPLTPACKCCTRE